MRVDGTRMRAFMWVCC